MHVMRSVARRGRRHLPPPAQAVARRAVLGFGWVTARWRMQPSFLIIGAQRSGTTTLFRLLSQHPSVVRPTSSKGVRYFDLGYAHGPRWYRAHFPLLVIGRMSGRAAQTFESSGYYANHPLAAQRIAADLPNAKVVLMVRDPVERAYSAHAHELARGFETEDFETALALEEERTAREEERLAADPAYVSGEHVHHFYLGRGRYVEQVDRFARELGEERVYVLDADRFFAEPRAEVAALVDWLGLPAWQPTALVHENARPRAPMSSELHDRLRAYYQPYDARLTDWLGHPPSWRAEEK